MTSSCHHAVCGHFFKVSDRAVTQNCWQNMLTAVPSSCCLAAASKPEKNGLQDLCKLFQSLTVGCHNLTRKHVPFTRAIHYNVEVTVSLKWANAVCCTVHSVHMKIGPDLPKTEDTIIS